MLWDMTVVESCHQPILFREPAAWRVRLVAAWRDNEFPTPIGEEAVVRALAAGIRLSPQPEHYEARFTVEAEQLHIASRLALGKWAHMVEVARLPIWDLIALDITEIRPHDESCVASGYSPDRGNHDDRLFGPLSRGNHPTSDRSQRPSGRER